MRSIDLYPIVKRTLDVTMAALCLVVLSPFLLLITLLVKLDSSGPVIFRQQRLGKGAVPFTMYKFRSMQHNAPVSRNPDGSYFVGENDPRLTRVGRFLREFTLDEAPQLFNVLKGDMSIIGPRPDLPEDLQSYDRLLRRKLAVRPGMANLALIHGRNDLSWRERAKWDAHYVNHRSLTLDLEIFIKTAVLVVLRKGVYYPDDYIDRV